MERNPQRTLNKETLFKEIKLDLCKEKEYHTLDIKFKYHLEFSNPTSSHCFAKYFCMYRWIPPELQGLQLMKL